MKQMGQRKGCVGKDEEDENVAFTYTVAMSIEYWRLLSCTVPL